MTTFTRRRFLAVAGASAAALSAGVVAGPLSASAAPRPLVWRGIALGAEAEIRLHLADQQAAAEILKACRAEIARLEGLFSLYRADSALNRLNRDGRLSDPDPDLLALLSLSASIHDATGGAFDPTVQPLWRAHADAGGQPSEPARARAARRIGYEHVRIDARQIGFTRPDMALTLNGIAQGYITDRVADLIRAQGLDHVLVNCGEHRALGGRPDGSAWPVRIAGSTDVIQLDNRALATSSTLGTVFDMAGTRGHIVDPRNGSSATTARQVSVEAANATLADGLSTAFCLMTPQAIAHAQRRYQGVQVTDSTAA